MKKNFFKSLFALLLVSFIAFYACSEDTINNDAQQTEIVKNAYTNPLEYIGVEHNNFMLDFTRKLEDSFLNGEWNRAAFLSDDYKRIFANTMNNAYHSRYTQTNSTVSYQKQVYDQLDLSEWFDRDNVTSLDLAAAVLNDRATSRDREYTLNLLHDLFNAANNAATNAEIFDAIKAVVTAHEQRILSQHWNDNEEYALGALAVAKYSAEFWKNYDFAVFTRGAERDPRSGIIVGADVAGYVVGGVVGGTAGSFAGPAGTVGGVLGGKAAGAWAGSAAAATAIAIYDAWCDFFS